MPIDCSHDFIFSIACEDGTIKRVCWNCEGPVEPSPNYFYLDEVSDTVWIYRKRHKDKDGNWIY